MKKTKFMRAALLLLVLTLITSCFVGGTFAKYTTSASGTDTARVAYWGFYEEPSTTINLFNTSYTDETNGETVKSSNGDKVVAPGTSGSSTFGFAYRNNTDKSISAPEVAYTFDVKVDTTGSNVDALDMNPAFVWTLDGNKYKSLSALTAAIEALGDNNGSNRYEAGTLPAAFGNSGKNQHTVGWVWEYDKNSTDTVFGNAQFLANVNLTISITATQID